MVNLDYLYNPDVAKELLTRNYLVNKKMGFQVIEHGTILPHKREHLPGKWDFGRGGIVDSQNNYIRESSVHIGTGASYTPPPESIQHSSETVIYLAMLYPVYGHCLTDNIRRLWFLKSDFFKNEFKNCPLIYIEWDNNNLEKLKSFRRLLEILEVDLDRLQPITKPTQYEQIILPDNAFESPHAKVAGFTNEYREMIDRVRDFALKNRTPTSNKKFYFLHGSRQIGEEWLAEYFKTKGYDVLRPERLTIDEQLNLLINAESFTAIVGSCAHNSLFLRDNIETILIPRTFNKFNYYQEIINQIHPLNVNYIDSSLSLFSKGIVNGNWLYIISEQLKRFFGDKWDGYTEEDFKNFLQYVKNNMNKGLVVNPSAREYYAPILEDFMSKLKQREDLITAYNMPKDWETFQPTFSYQTHIHIKSWVAWQNEEQVSGSTENKLDIQAVKINFPNHNVYYSVYYNAEEGWSEEVSNGEQAGTTGKTKAIYGIKIRLDEAGQKEFDILYRVHKFDGEWTDWAKNGETLYSYGQKLNALQIKLEPKT